MTNIKGPTSALTSYLRERGIRAPNARRASTQPTPAATQDQAEQAVDRNENAGQNGQNNSDANATGAAEESVDQNVAVDLTEADEDPGVGSSTAAASQSRARSAAYSKAKKGKAKGKHDKDSDDDDDDFMQFASSMVPRMRHTKKRGRDDADDENLHRLFHGVRLCSRCHRRFIPAAELGDAAKSRSKGKGKKDDNDDDLCGACLTVQGGGSGSVRALSRLKRKQAEMEAFTIAGERGAGSGVLLSLRDLCIQRVAELIEDVEDFGDDISYASLRKISMIISKRRQLNDRTALLFVGSGQDTVELFDCTKIDEDGLMAIAKLCPDVQTLNLSFCGRMTDAALAAIGESCPLIQSLTLRGPFLPKDNAFASLFRSIGEGLSEVVLEHAAKLSDASIEALRDACPHLRLLSLTECTHVGDRAVHNISQMQSLERLELRGLGRGVTPSSLIALVDRIGSRLTHLCLDNYELLDDAVVARIADVCVALTSLSLGECPSVTNDGMLHAMTHLLADPSKTTSTALIDLSLRRNTLLQDPIITTIATRFGKTLQHLDLNGLDDLTPVSLASIASSCVSLVRLNISWIRCVDDVALESILCASPRLKSVAVFGCHEVSQAVLCRVWRNANDEIIDIVGNEFD